MGLFLLLLFISVANLGISGTEILRNSNLDDVSFPINMLKPDLDAIAKYHSMNKNYLDAFIYWPNGIVFHVQRARLENRDVLRVNGEFRARAMSPYCLYYEDGHFSVTTTTAVNTPLLISPFLLADAHYKQPETMEQGKSYLSIRYRSLEEIKSAITSDPSYSKSAFDGRRSTYLATWGEPTDQFMEYTNTEGYGWFPPGHEELLALIGKFENNKVTIQRSSQSVTVVYDHDKETVTVQDAKHESYTPVKNVFGVRMAIGFLAEVNDGNVKMLSLADLVPGANPLGHVVPWDEFLEKSKKVKPFSCSNEPNPEFCKQYNPESGKLQFYGHILIKKINYEDTTKTEVDEKCPVVIENERNDVNFVFGGTTTNRICSDDEKLWDGSLASPDVPGENFDKVRTELFY